MGHCRRGRLAHRHRRLPGHEVLDQLAAAAAISPNDTLLHREHVETAHADTLDEAHACRRELVARYDPAGARRELAEYVHDWWNDVAVNLGQPKPPTDAGEAIDAYFDGHDSEVYTLESIRDHRR